MENASPSILEKDSLRILRDALDTLEEGFSNLPPADAAVADYKAIELVIIEVAERLRDNYPYFHPLYAGQMLKPPHPVARLASMLAMWINPNNHALDGGRASSRMEKEAVSEIAAMFGWEKHLGHLTGGGTMANLEALWVANRLSPASRIVASEQAHYCTAASAPSSNWNMKPLPATGGPAWISKRSKGVSIGAGSAPL